MVLLWLKACRDLRRQYLTNKEKVLKRQKETRSCDLSDLSRDTLGESRPPCWETVTARRDRI